MGRRHGRDASDLHGGSSGTNDDATASKLSLSQNAAMTNHYNQPEHRVEREAFISKDPSR
ncbi:unnamed protein product [Musa acuminata subsp. malaccensis]|uniref:(wild Malaysian banana) hypothetical protein n=1 Tax=Musa acuminata subsp. malaccensis TaxID=214687 RepID=A0A804ITV3_MUSAM|nr:unnamed protein product [Musa acuminata subsp. malaccensis]